MVTEGGDKGIACGRVMCGKGQSEFSRRKHSADSSIDLEWENKLHDYDGYDKHHACSSPSDGPCVSSVLRLNRRQWHKLHQVEACRKPFPIVDGSGMDRVRVVTMESERIYFMNLLTFYPSLIIGSSHTTPAHTRTHGREHLLLGGKPYTTQTSLQKAP